ncbi:MAG: hypothetical protein QG571_1620, partial [Pseudomonadota bacterium]|nr:hypothetical protein [Pseudomonadota bacterium]
NDISVASAFFGRFTLNPIQYKKGAADAWPKNGCPIALSASVRERLPVIASRSRCAAASAARRGIVRSGHPPRSRQFPAGSRRP